MIRFIPSAYASLPQAAVLYAKRDTCNWGWNDIIRRHQPVGITDYKEGRFIDVQNSARVMILDAIPHYALQPDLHHVIQFQDKMHLRRFLQLHYPSLMHHL